jgi:opacity protein-like surface antigen
MRNAVLIALMVCGVRLQAADFELGIRHVATTFTGDAAFAGGELDVVSTRGFAATAEVFWTPRVSTQFAATFVNPAAILFPVNTPPHDVDLGTLGLDTYSASARWHFAPQSRWSAFAGGGVALVSIGNLEDRFGDDIELTYENETAFLVEGGVRFRFLPNVYLDVTISYMPLETEPNFVRNDTNVVLPPRLSLNPATISAGAAWRW